MLCFICVQEMGLINDATVREIPHSYLYGVCMRIHRYRYVHIINENVPSIFNEPDTRQTKSETIGIMRVCEGMLGGGMKCIASLYGMTISVEERFLLRKNVQCIITD